MTAPKPSLFQQPVADGFGETLLDELAARPVKIHQGPLSQAAVQPRENSARVDVCNGETSHIPWQPRSQHARSDDRRDKADVHSDIRLRRV